MTLGSGNFRIVGARSATNDRWYEFSAAIDGVVHAVGGQTGRTVLEEMRSLFTKERGKRIRDIPNAPYRHELGDVEYLGHLAFSGYTTLYVFRDDSSTLHVVLAAPDGKLIAHTRLDAAAREQWEGDLARHLG